MVLFPLMGAVRIPQSDRDSVELVNDWLVNRWDLSIDLL